MNIYVISAIIVLLIGFIFFPFFRHDKRNNCFFFTIRMYIKYGGYITIRGFLKGCGPHFQWLPYDKGQDLIQYKPIKRKKGWAKYIHMFWFEGHIVQGDQEYIDKTEGREWEDD